MSSPDALASNRTLARAASILDAVDGAAVSASELARRSGLSVSTAHRLALSMVEYGFLRRTDAGEFRLGHRFVRSAVEQSALPRLTELKKATGETVQLWVRRGDERICLLSIDSDHELKASLPPGSRLPLPEGSSGRLLAGDPEALASLDEHGWVESAGVRTPGLGSVSAPVHVRDRLLASVCLAVPLSRVSVSPGRDFGAAVAAAAQQIAADLELIPNA
ncbi:helix-turn-helix domain-containing protein [Arthrobacter sp. ES3-54]|jgi:DNA-binding IclR family transcriptional regulator|uniref:IclR family transcriptional regulator n=1 Tax=Arthrobacter sp. ES3-54 TaxID=1502991 RepID=UPI002405D70C|nr:helix-turn-helix domain-containing protein [Arthrobacter sp. ES3-54]MDF9749618.1 DNA-binding IclR family transcriptional regulator [Arthrobacter sp. ES3-54]